jgi:hypothetical protein
MSFDVIISFRNNSEYSNLNKNILISLLPGPYKISHETLSDMDKKGKHIFSFPKEEVATKFAQSVQGGHNSIFDVQTNFKY